MFVTRKAALRPIPKWSRIEEADLSRVEASLEEDADGLQRRLDLAYRDMDRRQPDLAAWVAEAVGARKDDLAQSLGYFLVVTIYLAFRETFGARLGHVDQAELTLAEQTYRADEALRRDDPAEVLETDDLVAIAQPSVVQYVQHHLEEAIEQAGSTPDLEAFDHIYRSVLVEVLVLSNAVLPPGGVRGGSSTALA